MTGGKISILVYIIKEKSMYGKGAGTLNVATGISLLPDTGNSHKLFYVAISLLVSGVVILMVSIILARKSRSSEAI